MISSDSTQLFIALGSLVAAIEILIEANVAGYLYAEA